MNYLYHVYYVFYDRHGELREGCFCCERPQKIKAASDYADLVKSIKEDILQQEFSKFWYRNNLSVIVRNIQLLYNPAEPDKRD